MIDLENMKVGDKIHMGDDEWDDDMRELLNSANEFANAQEPRWQFQSERYFYAGNKSGKGDKYHLERLR